MEIYKKIQFAALLDFKAVVTYQRVLMLDTFEGLIAESGGVWSISKEISGCRNVHLT